MPSPKQMEKLAREAARQPDREKADPAPGDPLPDSLTGLLTTLGDLSVLLRLLARSGTGQRLTTYTTLITGPRRPGEPDGPDEVHVVILDNGRSNLVGGRYREMLACIRCGACLNVCPVYRKSGGGAYCPVYSGPMGAVLVPRRLWLIRLCSTHRNSSGGSTRSPAHSCAAPSCSDGWDTSSGRCRWWALMLVGRVASARHSVRTRCFCSPITWLRWEALGQP